jgi:hypothetical protein
VRDGTVYLQKVSKLVICNASLIEKDVDSVKDYDDEGWNAVVDEIEEDVECEKRTCEINEY